MRHVFKLFDMSSSQGIGLVVVNLIGMLWVDVYKHGFNMAHTSVIAAIFAAKTVHGVMTNGGSNVEKV